MNRRNRSSKKTAGFAFIRSFEIWLLPALLAFSVADSQAETLAAKNRKGNQFYAQKKYAEAEKEYLDAQVKNPGNPAILYNLGNSLIRQEKFGPGVKALDQAIESGDKAAKKNSWYNKGNALFGMGAYRDSANAFIEALKLDSSDKDAKHNLELALMKLKEEERQKQQSGKEKPGEAKQPADNSQNQPAPGSEDRQKQSSRGGAQQRKEQKEAPKRETTQTPDRKGAVGSERALQILDAIQNQERDEQRKLLERRTLRDAEGKDW